VGDVTNPTSADFLNDLLKRVDVLAAQLTRMEEQLAQLAVMLERHTEAVESGVSPHPPHH
jgi:hypothetical protein